MRREPICSTIKLVYFHLKRIEKWPVVESWETFNGGLQNYKKAIFYKVNQPLLFRQTSWSCELTGVFHVFDVSLCCLLPEIAGSQRKKLHF